MINLLLAIVSSMMVSVTMRLSEKHAKNNVSMLAVNYVMCAALSWLYAGELALLPAGRRASRSRFYGDCSAAACTWAASCCCNGTSAKTA